MHVRARTAVCRDSCGLCSPESRNSGDSGRPSRSPETEICSPGSMIARATELAVAVGMSPARKNATFRRSFRRADPRRPSRLTFFQVKLQRGLARRAWGWARRLIPEQSHRHPHGQSHGAVAPVLWTKRPLSMLRLFLSHASSEECRRVGKWEEGRRVGKWRSID